jgi:hypothetical protein
MVAGACFRLSHNSGVFGRALHLGLRPLAEARECAQATSKHVHEELAAEPELGQITGCHTRYLPFVQTALTLQTPRVPRGGFAFLTPRSARSTVGAALASRYGRAASQRPYTDLHTFAHRLASDAHGNLREGLR